MYFFVFGTTPAYKQVGETFTLQLPPEVNKYSRHFKRFLLLSLDHEMENRFADFDQCRESKWVDSQFGCVVVDTPQQIRYSNLSIAFSSIFLLLFLVLISLIDLRRGGGGERKWWLGSYALPFLGFFLLSLLTKTKLIS